MASNRFGNLFTVTTFGESHGPMIGVVIDGCPAGLRIDRKAIETDMKRRRPGYRPQVSERKEPDEVEFVSGLYEGKTTGAPLTLLIHNRDAIRDGYESIKEMLRPGHANFTYLQKYGIFDERGGGRASGRETAARVAAGAIAKQLIAPALVKAEVIEIGGETSNFEALLAKAEEEGDSLGGIIECRVSHLPPGIGDPIYEKIEARLAFAMLSIPATKGFEIGEGFQAAKMRGSEHNDLYRKGEEGEIICDSNHHGGALGGITTGEELIFRVAFKPTSSIKIPQATIDIHRNERVLTLPTGSRHDVCIALRAPPIVEAMAAITICDLMLMNRCSKCQS